MCNGQHARPARCLASHGSLRCKFVSMRWSYVDAGMERSRSPRSERIFAKCTQETTDVASGAFIVGLARTFAPRPRLDHRVHALVSRCASVVRIRSVMPVPERPLLDSPARPRNRAAFAELPHSLPPFSPRAFPSPSPVLSPSFPSTLPFPQASKMRRPPAQLGPSWAGIASMEWLEGSVLLSHTFRTRLLFRGVRSRP
jgi:hypothetical protein